MKLLVIYSGKPGPEIKKEFAQTFDDHYASRFIRHLDDDPTLCTGCGDKCSSCRLDYGLDFSASVKTLTLPTVMPYFVDNVDNYLEKPLPAHDVTIPINIHEDILLSLPEIVKESGSKAIIAPIEDPDWITRWTRLDIAKKCKELGLEFAFPKPFCSLELGAGPYIDRFIKEFRVGRPLLNLRIDNNNVIREATVEISAPCGNTYFVAKNIIGKTADKKLNEWVAKYWHSYPCVASMKMDPELGDTILHKGGYIHYDIVSEAICRANGQKAAS